MKSFLVLSTLVSLVVAVPNGFYYQQSSSKSSSSSYKNNELQHQTEDESHYSRQGDTEGRTQPKVNTYSQHLKYQNPNNQNQDHLASYGSHSQNALGHTDDSDVHAARQAVGSDGIVRTVSGNRDHYTYTATYGVSGGKITPLQGGQYDTQSNLLSLTQRVQNDLSKQLNNAITQQKTYDSHGSNTYIEGNFRNLERELRSNLSRQLQEELQRQYGAQINRGSHSYTFQDGQYLPQANYNTQELQDLTSQLENNLMKQLRNQYQNTESSSNSYYSSSQQTEQGSRAHTSMYRPTYPGSSFPLHPEIQPSIPLTDVLSQVQNTVDRRLNDALSQIEGQYLTQNIYTEVPNYDTILENLREELKRNISSILQTTLVEHYGTQEEHNDYYYSSRKVATGSKVANYKIDDLNSLKQQVENNLIQKLKNSIQQQRQTFQTSRQSYSQSQTYNTNHNTGYSNTRPNTPEVYTSYVVFTPRRPDSTYSQTNTHNTRRPDSTYSQTNTHDTGNTYTSYNGQTNTGPEYRPSNTPTDSQRPIRYGTYQPSSQNTNYGTNTYRTSSQNQDSQRVEQLEYDSSPTGSHYPSGTGPTQTTQTPVRGTYYPSNSGSNIPSSGAQYLSNSGSNIPSTSGQYPSNSGSNIPSSGAQYPSNSNGAYPTGHYPSSSGTSYPSGSSGSNHQTNYQTYQENREATHKIVTGQRESGVEYTSSSSRPQQPEYQAELINIRDQVQNDLSRQVNTAIENQRQSSSSYSSSSVSNNQVLDELSEELKRNLTKKIEQTLNEHYGRTGVRGGYSFTVSSGGRINPGNYNREQLTTLTNKLQEDLLRQLREGLAHRQSSSYSSSYEPVMSQGTYGHGSNMYKAYSSGSSYSYSSGGTNGECCMQADDSTTAIVEETDQSPTRGDIGIKTVGQGKSKDADLEEQLTQQKTEDFQTPKNYVADIEVVPSEATETTTQKLARNKPSTRKPSRLNPTRQDENPIQRIPTNQGARVTQDLINFERHENENQQQTQQFHQFDNISQQRTQNSGYTNQQIVGQSHFDQDTIDEYDQQTTNQLSGQHATQYEQQTSQAEENINQNQETERVVQSTIQKQHNEQENQPIEHMENLNQQIENLSQQMEDLNQQTYDLNQRTEDLNQYTEDLIPQTEDLNQQTQDLNQQTEDLNQQTEDLNQQTENLNQQTANFNQQTGKLNIQTGNLNQHTEDVSQHTADVNQHIDLNQYTGDLNPQTVDLNQQTEDLNQQVQGLNQQTEDLHQQTEDLHQQTEDLHQQTVYFNQQSEHSARQIDDQQTEDLNQQRENLNQQTEDLNQQTEDLNQQAQDSTQQLDLTQHIENLNQQLEQQNFNQEQSIFAKHNTQHQPHILYGHQTSAESQNNQHSDLYRNHHSHSAIQSHNSQSSSSYSSSENRHIHYGTVSHVPVQTTTNLQQQVPELQNANVVQDVSHQVRVPSSFSGISNMNEQELEDIEIITSTEKAGFWNKLGGKIGRTFNKAKDAVTSIG